MGAQAYFQMSRSIKKCSKSGGHVRHAQLQCTDEMHRTVVSLVFPISMNRQQKMQRYGSAQQQVETEALLKCRHICMLGSFPLQKKESATTIETNRSSIETYSISTIRNQPILISLLGSRPGTQSHPLILRNSNANSNAHPQQAIRCDTQLVPVTVD